MSFIFLFINLFVIIFYFKKILLNKKIILFSIFLPVLLNFSYNIVLNSLQKSPIYLNHGNNYMKVFSSSIIRDQTDTEIHNANMFSSGRFENWKSAINIISKKPIIGYGAQSDRIYIKQSIHNSILYTTLSGGLISGISLVLIYLYTVYLLFNFYFFNFKKFNGKTEIHASAGILIMIGLRSVLETSIAVFSIDYILFIISFVILNYSLSKNRLEKLDKIYYWANNISKNSGEGILALNFLKLLKKKIKKQYYLNLINLKKEKVFL